MSFREAQLREIRSRIDLVDFIGKIVELKKAGARWQGLCPFHSEKTPSFDVSRDRGTFKCFGCQEQGDVFAFVMKTQSLSFPDAVRQVAAEAGVEVEARMSGGRGGRRGPEPQPAAGRSASASHHSGEVREIGEAKGAKQVAVYDYRSRRGQLLYQVVRYEPKTFRQRRPHPTRKGHWVPHMREEVIDGVQMPDQPTTLYRLPELFDAIAAGDRVWIVEGEKDVEALWAAEQVATCSSGGAGKWRDELSTPFKDFRGQVLIVQDRDEPGEAHALEVFESLAPVLGDEAILMIVEARVGKDAADHLGAGHTVDQFVQVWPLPENLLDTDPKRFKQIILRKVLDRPKTVLEHTPHDSYAFKDQPFFLSGLVNLSRSINWQGCVVLSGAPSAGKSFVSMGCGIDNAEAGWDVWYFSAEMPAVEVRIRAARAMAGRQVEDWTISNEGEIARMRIAKLADGIRLPERFNIVDVGIGVTIEEMCEFLIEKVTDRHTLVILDSVSSLVDAMEIEPGDSWGGGHLREITRWSTQLAKLSHGRISFLILSEINTEGRAKGRAIDHRCNYALAMTSSEEEGQHDRIKAIRTTKSWHAPTGKIGDFLLWWQLCRLSRIEE